MPSCSLADLVRYFVWLGTTGFGGPIALVGFMQRDLVEERRWFSAEEYREGWRSPSSRPGPLAAQLAMYLGWARGGAAGAALVGLAFVVPSFVMVLALAIAYLRFGGLAWMQGAFYGDRRGGHRHHRAQRLQADAAHARPGRLPVGAIRGRGASSRRGPSPRSCGCSSAPAFWRCSCDRPRSGARPRSRAHAAAVRPLCGPLRSSRPATLWRIGWYFAEAGAFVFGSGLAIVPFLHSGVVREFGWLSERQFLDAVAVAMITPGPVVITVAFIGYLVAGPAGAVVAALGTFLPCYLFTVVPAPYFRRWSRNASDSAFVEGVTRRRDRRDRRSRASCSAAARSSTSARSASPPPLCW